MNSKVAAGSPSKYDAIKWALVGLLIIAGVAANYYFVEQAIAIRLAGWLVLACVAGLVAAQTAKGRQIVAFAKEARTELRKVVWPTRQETVQMTIIVMIIIAIMGLVLWGLDSILLWAVSWLTNLA